MHRVTVLIMNWNGRHLLKECLTSVVQRDYPEKELIVLDCGSQDGSDEFVRREFPNVKLIRYESDPLADYAWNAGIRAATGRYVMLLNNDVKLPGDTLTRLALALSSNEREVVVPRELSMTGEPSKHRGVYKYALPFYVVLERWLGLSITRTPRPFVVSIACAMASRSVLLQTPANDKVGFYEELEWFWRLRLRQIQPRVVEDACFYHVGAATAGVTLKSAYYGGRNHLIAHYECLSSLSLAVFAPVLCLLCLGKAGLYALHGQWREANAFLRGLADFSRTLGVWSAARRETQRTRQTSDFEILRAMIGSCVYVYGSGTGRR